MSGARSRAGRRDRRKAKASGWRRAGTVSPKKVAHHPYDPHTPDPKRRGGAKALPGPAPMVVTTLRGPLATLGDRLRAALGGAA